MTALVRIGDETYQKCAKCGILRNSEVRGPCLVCKDKNKSKGYRRKSEAKLEIEALRAQGYTYDEIGERYGVTRQRVHQILRGRSGT